MAGLSLAYLAMTTASYKENKSYDKRQKVDYVAEAGLSEALAIAREQGRLGLDAVVYPQSFGSETYSVTVTWGEDNPSMDDDLVLLTAIGTDETSSVAFQAVGRILGGAGDSIPWGIFGEQRIRMNSNSLFDSYDSGLGVYSTQITGTFEGTDYAASNTPVRSNGDIDLDSNSGIFGDATPGTGDSVSTQSNSQVFGSTAPAPADLTLPAIDVPSLTSLGNLTLNSGTMNLAAGDYRYGRLRMEGNGTLNIEGPSTLVFDRVTIDSNSIVRVDGAGGPVEVYVTGRYEQNSNTEFRPLSNDPVDLTLFVSGSGSTVTFDSNTSFTGRIYAPERKVMINSNSSIWGAVVSGEIESDSNGKIHFDERLGTANTSGAGPLDIEILSWRSIPVPTP